MTQTGEWPEQPPCPMNNNSEMLGGQPALRRTVCDRVGEGNVGLFWFLF